MKWFKHTISILTIISIALFAYAGGSIDETRTIHGSLFFVYSLFVFFTLLIYRISLIERTSIKWTSLILTVLVLSGLTVIQLDKSLFYSLWNITLAGFILLSGDAVLQITPKNRPLTKLSKITTGILLILLLSILTFQIGSTTIFFVTEMIMLLSALLILVNFFLKKRSI